METCEQLVVPVQAYIENKVLFIICQHLNTSCREQLTSDCGQKTVDEILGHSYDFVVPLKY